MVARPLIFTVAALSRYPMESRIHFYAVTAYLLSLNGIIGETDVMNAATLPKVKMPNRDNFIPAYPWKPKTP